jgi:hypothetical protein
MEKQAVFYPVLGAGYGDESDDGGYRATVPVGRSVFLPWDFFVSSPSVKKSGA